MMSFEIKGDLAKIQAFELDANFAALKEWLNGELEGYKNLVVLPETVSEAKADRAKIRKIANSIDEQRKAVKKAFMTPYMAFEEKCKEPIALCREVVEHIDSQIKEYENAQKAEKEAEIKRCFDEAAKKLNVSEFVRWERIFNPKWLNVTFSIDEAKREADGILKRAAEEVEIIRAQNEKYVPMLLEQYSRNADLAETMRQLKAWEYAEKREAELKKAASSAAEKCEKPTASQPRPVQAKTARTETAEEEKLYTVGFKVRCNMRQLAALKAFLTDNKIEYRPL